MTVKPSPFKFDRDYNFPPFFSRQPTLATRASQLEKWSSLIQAYCRHYRIFRLFLIDALDTPLFYNSKLGKRLSMTDAREIVDAMSMEKAGGARAEWANKEKNVAWIYWKRPEEWAEVISQWEQVEDTGQKNTVLTLYELTEGETTIDQEFHGMDPDVLQKSLAILVKRGSAQVFGMEDHQGAKFF